MLTIKNFRKEIDFSVYHRGVQYYTGKRINKLVYSGSGCCVAEVKGTRKYEVEIQLGDKGEVLFHYCSCPYWEDNEDPCKHIVAVLLEVEKIYERENETGSSEEAYKLIEDYRRQAAFYGTQADPELGSAIRLTPELETKSGITMSLKIGREKMYKVKSIPKLYDDFKEEKTVRYGKGLELCHKIRLLDGRSKRLLEMAAGSCLSMNYYYRSDSAAPLDGVIIDEFFEMYKDEEIICDGENYRVTFCDPEITFTLSREKNDRFKLVCDSKYKPAGRGRGGSFLDKEGGNIYFASESFTNAVYGLYRTAYRERAVYISRDDMPAFYTAVLKPVSEYARLSGAEIIEELIPPELSAQLYIDCSEDNMIFGKLIFAYGDEIYTAFSGKKSPGYDKVGEQAAVAAVIKYFVIAPGNDHHPMRISGDDNIYEFVTTGLTELSKAMELFISERFRRIAVRPPVKPVIKMGLRPGGGLLELDIEDGNYSPEELAEVLAAYRRGAKYHRLKDGSFVLPGESLSELSEIMDNLDVSIKDIAKKNLKIPAYRMLYLDSLKNGKNIRLRESDEVKRTVKKYNEEIRNEENSPVPEGLRGVMRDYQEYGFRWLKAVSSYGFGGILADDMGLGKTIQAIALMLCEKDSGGEHKTNFIVCPSSLTLNWESEIKRFAPRLSTLVVIGTAEARGRLIEEVKTGEYDAVITSYASLTRDIDKYENIKFHLHFIDEAQYIKNHGTQSSKAVKGICSERRFALTGTPVENSLAELWSIFDFIMPGYLFGYTRFKKNFETPIVSKGDKKVTAALRKNVTPFILRRMKSDVLEELPEKTETTLRSSMEGEQKKLYTANAANLKKSVKQGFGDSPADKIQILAMLTRLRQICCDPGLVFENYKGGSAKLEMCMELIESCVNSGHKLLLFSQFTSMLDIIAKRLEDMGTAYYMLTGSTKARDRIRMVNDFNGNSVPVFLISLKAGGTGLNLTGADIVIHYDPWWNVSAQEQASDRVYRIGQKRNVQVYRLIAGGTIEENILKLQEDKARLGEIISGGGDITKMSAEEIAGLL